MKKLSKSDFQEGDVMLTYSGSPVCLLQKRWGYKDYFAAHSEVYLHGELFTFDGKGGNSVPLDDYLHQNVVLFRHYEPLTSEQLEAAYKLKADLTGKPYDVGQLLDIWRRTRRRILGKNIRKAEICDWYSDSVVCSVAVRMIYEAMGLVFNDEVPSEDTPPAFFTTVLKPVGYHAGRKRTKRFLKHINKIYK